VAVIVKMSKLPVRLLSNATVPPVVAAPSAAPGSSAASAHAAAAAVVATAATRDEAVAKAHSERPGLVLADINLGEGGSGIDAVADILASFDIPVIFVTAYPERLLTGERPEPTYLIAKPFLPETVQATVGQALFFHPVARQAA